jgi:xylan 1,4-beta-xylosidase
MLKITRIIRLLAVCCIVLMNCSLLLAQTNSKKKVFKYTNPITRDSSQSMRDHCILKVGERWYMTGTSQPIWSGINPGVRLMVSDDLLNWRDTTWIIDAKALPAECPYNGRFWAPEIHKINGKFYLSVNSGHEGEKTGNKRMDEHKVWIFSADHVTGPYSLITPQGLGLSKYFTNDASLFGDDDGRAYVYCCGGGLWQAEIDLKTGKLADETKGLSGFTKIIGEKDQGNPDWMYAGIEGPYVIKRNGAYWMFFSSWTRGYEVGILKGESPLGPWKLVGNEPIFGTRKHEVRDAMAKKDGYAHVQYEDTKDPYVEVGHNAIFEGPDGKDWICCHYWLRGNQVESNEHVPIYGNTREQLGFEPVKFEDGIFKINGPTWTKQVVKWRENK